MHLFNKVSAGVACMVALTAAAPTKSDHLTARGNRHTAELDDWATNCELDTMQWNQTNFDKVLSTYHDAFGDGGGTLDAGKDAAPTYQGVCCEGSCLFVQHNYLPHTMSWNSTEFADAVDRIQEAGVHYGSCTTDMTYTTWDKLHKDRPALFLSYKPATEKLFKKSDSVRGKWVGIGEEMGDTCRGVEAYRGPHD